MKDRNDPIWPVGTRHPASSPAMRSIMIPKEYGKGSLPKANGVHGEYTSGCITGAWDWLMERVMFLEGGRFLPAYPTAVPQLGLLLAWPLSLLKGRTRKRGDASGSA